MRLVGRGCRLPRPGVRSRGVGRSLYAHLLAELRALDYVSAFAGVALLNDASERFHAALGFTPIGVFDSVGFKPGAWRDVSWWQMRLVEAPHEPRAWEPAETAREG